MTWEFTLQSWNDVIESKGVGRKVNPSGVCSEQSKSVSWPETVRSLPGGDIGLSLSHIGSEVLNIEFPSATGALIFKVLDEDLCPLGTRNILVDMLNSLGVFHLGNIHISGDTNVSLKFLISLIIGMI